MFGTRGVVGLIHYHMSVPTSLPSSLAKSRPPTTLPLLQRHAPAETDGNTIAST